VGRTLTPAEQAEQLRDLIRQAHEAVKDLRAELRRADQLAPELVKRFEEVHDRETDQLVSHLTDTAVTVTDQMRAAVEEARGWMLDQLCARELVLDPVNNVVKLMFPHVDLQAGEVTKIPHPSRGKSTK
jgi:hypothetical protein